ncbi:transmembrane protein 26 [Astyanax mexicanus]|uniref:Transmembrane protein 26 n=1 Tax=Astyanax mexicanus TaxID=7994 RepID=A0A8B9RH10_ASTMX|nr:transmembrane protein 26 [Astyanax mexicanus]
MLLKFLCALITRALFILISLIGVWRVTWVKNNKLYWFLTILYLPLVIELILTLRRRKGKDYKWFSPAIFLFLISIIPTIWILELHHQQNRSSDAKCAKLDSSESIKDIFSNWKNSSSNTTEVFKFFRDSEKILSSVCANDWILALHQILLILLIVGKWLMPIGVGVTRDELSQLLLIFVGTAADILEFTSETLSDVKDNSPQLVYIILAVWTWSMLQFPFHLSVVNSRDDDECENQGDSVLTKHRTDFWTVVETLFIQDGPFLVVRLTVMIHYAIVHQMLVFFAIKNFLVVTLNIYRMWVIFQDYRSI